MHFCKEPLEVLEYYPLVDENGDQSEFAEVEALGKVVTDDDKKFCTNKLKIGAKLNFAKLVQIAVDFDYEKFNENIQDDKNKAQIGSSGDGAQIGSSGDGAVIMCVGRDSCAKGKIGSWITLAEWKYDTEKEHYIPICVKTEQIDGKKIKPDTLYKLKNGEFVEAESEDE